MKQHAHMTADSHEDKNNTQSQRLDKWLWAARFFKTRSLAAEALDRGRVTVNGQSAKRSKEIRVGDQIHLTQASHRGPGVTLDVRGLSPIRGPASQAQTLYAETTDSQRAHAQWQEQRHCAHEPAHDIEGGRPTKKDRRDLMAWERWSASMDRLERHR